LEHGSGDVHLIALAASVVGSRGWGRLLVRACWLLAHELALRARAEGRLLALPVALGLLAHRGAHSVRGSASSAALGRSANGLALRAVSGLAEILRATNVALRLVAMDLASSARGLLAVDLALWSLAHRVALSRARRVIALPSALRVACSRSGRLHILRTDGDQGNEGEHSEKVERTHLGVCD